MTSQNFSIPPPNRLLAWIVLIIAFLMIVALFSQCTRMSNVEKENRIKPDGISTVEIDHCQYIEVRVNLNNPNGYYSLTHKGNCPNPIHCYNEIPSK